MSVLLVKTNVIWNSIWPSYKVNGQKKSPGQPPKLIFTRWFLGAYFPYKPNNMRVKQKMLQIEMEMHRSEYRYVRNIAFV